jgi:metal-responsive CopG/Arc/MetJ family transcriptional regulator
MGKAKIAITIDKQSIGELDRLVKEDVFQNRSQAIQEAVSEKLLRLKKARLIVESAKLEQVSERKLAEEGLAADVEEWPEY